MPIEFRCTQCNKLLRTADETAGKQAKCPECGTLLSIPDAPSGDAGAGAPPPPMPDAGSPFGPGAAQPDAGSPFAPGGPQPAAGFDPDNPYASPGEYAATGPPGVAEAPGVYAPTIIDIGDVLGRTWAIFKAEWGMCLLAVIVVWAISFAVNLACAFIPFVGGLISGLFGIWLGIGLTLFLMKTARGQEAELGDIFSGGPFFLNVFLFQLLIGVIMLAVLPMRNIGELLILIEIKKRLLML